MKKLITIIAAITFAFSVEMLSGSITNASAYTGDALLLNLQESISQSVGKVRPSVVSVRAQKKKQAAGGGANDVMWFQSIGSGVIVDQRGYVLTNLHVVNGSENIDVKLWRSQNNMFKAAIVDEDTSLDLALLKMESIESLPVAELGNSGLLKTGNYIICIGSPFGFNHSVTLGIVSDLHREMVIDGVTYKDMIQTDAVINEGNSGGPVIDIYGRVMGISTAIYAPDGTYRGIGFAIPVNRTKQFFSRVTGAVVTSQPAATVITGATGMVTAAATAPNPNGPDGKPKKSVDLNKKMPGDKAHQEFSDCTTCHIITKKIVVSMQAKMTHPPIGSCDACHILNNDPVAAGPLPVAATFPMAAPFVSADAPSIGVPAGSFNQVPSASPTGAPVDPVAGQSATFSTTNKTFEYLFRAIIFKLGLMTFVSSIIFSMVGLGGGFVYVPLLLSCDVDFYTAASTSLIMITLSQMSALYNFFKSELVDLKLAAVLEPPTMVGAFLGGMLAKYFNVDALSIMFSCTVFIASYFMMRDGEIQKSDGSNGIRISISPFKWQHEFRGREINIDLGFSIPVTFTTGFFGGLLGLAASWIKVPIMILILNVPVKVAIATSSLMVPITAFCGFLGHSVAGHLDIRLASILSLITVVGAQIGSKLALGSDSNLLRFMFAFVLSVVGLWMLLRVF